MNDILISNGSGWFQVPNWIFDVDHELSPYEILTYLYLVRFASLNEIFPSYNTIASRCNFSRDTAIRAIAGLEKKGFLRQSKGVSVWR